MIMSLVSDPSLSQKVSGAVWELLITLCNRETDILKAMYISSNTIPWHYPSRILPHGHPNFHSPIEGGDSLMLPVCGKTLNSFFVFSWGLGFYHIYYLVSACLLQRPSLPTLFKDNVNLVSTLPLKQIKELSFSISVCSYTIVYRYSSVSYVGEN